MPDRRIAHRTTASDWAHAFAAYIAQTYALEATVALAIADAIEPLVANAVQGVRPGMIDVPERVAAQVTAGVALQRMAEADALADAVRAAQNSGSPWRITADSWATAFVEQLAVTHEIPGLVPMRLAAEIAEVLDRFGISDRPVVALTPWIHREVNVKTIASSQQQHSSHKGGGAEDNFRNRPNR